MNNSISSPCIGRHPFTQTKTRNSISAVLPPSSGKIRNGMIKEWMLTKEPLSTPRSLCKVWGVIGHLHTLKMSLLVHRSGKYTFRGKPFWPGGSTCQHHLSPPKCVRKGTASKQNPNLTTGKHCGSSKQARDILNNKISGYEKQERVESCSRGKATVETRWATVGPRVRIYDNT